MMHSQEVGRRYLAGFVIASAALYLGATCVVSAIAWPESDPWWLSANLFALGLVPSFVAFFLGRKAWSTKQTKSPTLSAIALVVLILGLVLWQTFVVSF